MPAQAERPNCGDCKHFETKMRLVDEPVSFRNPRNGLCRAPYGLALGMLSPETRCRQPEKRFEQKETVVTFSSKPSR